MRLFGALVAMGVLFGAVFVVALVEMLGKQEEIPPSGIVPAVASPAFAERVEDEETVRATSTTTYLSTSTSERLPTTTVELTTTTTNAPDYPDPVFLEIPLQGIAAGIDPKGPGFGDTTFEPARGRLDWWLDEDTVGPCERGSAYILGHNPGVFRDLVDDPDPGAGDQYGVYIDDEALVKLEDGTVCVYRVVEFASSFGETLEGTPARRFLKEEWSAHDWANIVAETGRKESVLFLLTSGGRENEYIWMDGGWHKPWLDVVKTVFVRAILPDQND